MDKLRSSSTQAQALYKQYRSKLASLNQKYSTLSKHIHQPRDSHHQEIEYIKVPIHVEKHTYSPCRCHRHSTQTEHHTSCKHSTRHQPSCRSKGSGTSEFNNLALLNPKNIAQIQARDPRLFRIESTQTSPVPRVAHSIGTDMNGTKVKPQEYYKGLRLPIGQDFGLKFHERPGTNQNQTSDIPTARIFKIASDSTLTRFPNPRYRTTTRQVYSSPSPRPLIVAQPKLKTTPSVEYYNQPPPPKPKQYRSPPAKLIKQQRWSKLLQKPVLLKPHKNYKSASTRSKSEDSRPLSCWFVYEDAKFATTKHQKEHLHQTYKVESQMRKLMISKVNKKSQYFKTNMN